MRPAAAFGATVMLGLCAVVADPLSGLLSDRIGRRPVMIWPNLVYAIVTVPLFFWIVQSRSAAALLVGSTALGFLSSLSGGAFYAALAETLPKRIRGSAFAIVYAFAIALFGGTTQLVVTWLIKATGSAMAPAWYLLAASIFGQIALMLILESAPVKAPVLAPAE